MKKSICIILIFKFITIAQTLAQSQISISVMGGYPVPKINGLNYGAGFGIKGGMVLPFKMYVGVVAALHSGDSRSINYGANGGLGIPGGRQNYISKPMYYGIDAGYRFGFNKIGLMPYLSMANVIISMSSNGVYGTPPDAKYSKFDFGFGLVGTVDIGKHFSVGVDYRTYPEGGANFDYGSLQSGRIPHGFRTSVFFGVLYSMMTYKF
jgi:hypothetical protein